MTFKYNVHKVFVINGVQVFEYKPAEWICVPICAVKISAAFILYKNVWSALAHMWRRLFIL